MKGIGIASMVLAIVFIFVPIAGPYLTFLLAFLVIFGIGEGFPFSLTSIIVNIAHIVFLSPSLYLAGAIVAVDDPSVGEGAVYTMVVFLSLVQLIALAVLVYRNKKQTKKDKES